MRGLTISEGGGMGGKTVVDIYNGKKLENADESFGESQSTRYNSLGSGQNMKEKTEKR